MGKLCLYKICLRWIIFDTNHTWKLLLLKMNWWLLFLTTSHYNSIIRLSSSLMTFFKLVTIILIPYLLPFEASDVHFDRREPPNEWGTYYKLPRDLPGMNSLFESAYKDSIYPQSFNQTKFSKCSPEEIYLEYWYQSSKNNEIFLFNCFCRQASIYDGYFTVNASTKQVLRASDYLSTFGIVDIGEYGNNIANDENFMRSLLDDVRDNLLFQAGSTDPSCIDPGLNTIHSLKFKVENELEYYQIRISCNIDKTSGYASHYTYIEVVYDSKYLKVNGGRAELAVLRNPMHNFKFAKIQKKDETQTEIVPDVKDESTAATATPCFCVNFSIFGICSTIHLLLFVMLC